MTPTQAESPTSGQTAPIPMSHDPLPSGQKLLISLATYNEAGNLRPLVTEILQTVPSTEVLIIDDASPDGTGQIADELAAEDARVHVMHRPGKLGLGTALLSAIRFADEQGYDLILNMDADFSHPPRFLPGILTGMDDHDVMVGSRYVPGGGTEGWPWSRKLISRSVNLMVRMLFRMSVRDASGAYRCYRVSMLRQARLDQVRSRGYSCQQEILYRCFLAGATIGEYPIVFENRRSGVSKVNWYEAVRSLSMLFYLGTRSFLGLDRRERPEGKPSQE